jgi:hypothetical protein
VATTGTTAETTETSADVLRAELAPYATEYRFELDGIVYRITRYDNHGGLLPDNGWAAVCWRGAMNPYYLVVIEGEWQWAYKFGTVFHSPERALVIIQQHPFPG